MSASYENLDWKRIGEAAARGAGVVLPVGAIEQHGPHLPVCTDSYLAHQLATAGTAEFDFLIAPMVPYGYRSRPLSGGGPLFPGTISLSGSTLVLVLKEVLQGVLEQGFRKVILYSWHMENQNFVYESGWLAAQDYSDARLVIMESPFAALSESTMSLLFGDTFPGWPAEHASTLETSLMLHLAPELVDMSRAVDDCLIREPDYDLIPPPSDFSTASGVLSQSKRAASEKGRVAFAEIAMHLAGVCATEFPELRLPPSTIETPPSRDTAPASDN